MSLFDLQDVCIAIGSIATLDLPMVVDLIGIYTLKGPYCTLTMTDWFLQALSVIPRGSWGDVARRFTMIRWATAAAADRRRRRRRFSRRKIVSGQLDEENPFVQNSSVLLVQADEGVSVLVIGRIGDIYRSLPKRADVIVTTVGARHKCQQDRINKRKFFFRPIAAAWSAAPSRAHRMRVRREASRTVRNTIARCPYDGLPWSRVGLATAAQSHACLSRIPGGAAGGDARLWAAMARRWAALERALVARSSNAGRASWPCALRWRRDAVAPRSATCVRLPRAVFFVVAPPPAGRRSVESPEMT
ncbi:hypothetical protein F511_44812 [Dorcoceras hygrometricum]|uniref:Uncharacterized protein n=1 Tax=Dorcoceras hygrometricum TaxID=472368 RepID=A0A2Z6ZXD5_9LAMI|nr:hypothetical protein F511_44812 [Dorcoceras hygrometricum]